MMPSERQLKDFLKKSTEIDSSVVIKDNINTMEFLGMEIFKKSDKLLDCEIFGIPLKYIGIIAGIVWAIRKNR